MRVFGFLRHVRNSAIPCHTCSRTHAHKYMPSPLPHPHLQGFGTVAYLSLTVAFIQMLKAFTPVITLLVLYYFGVEKPRKMLIMCVVFVCGVLQFCNAHSLWFTLVHFGMFSFLVIHPSCCCCCCWLVCVLYCHPSKLLLLLLLMRDAHRILVADQRVHWHVL